MTYSISFSDTAIQQLKKLNRDLRKRIISSLERCRIRPYAHVKKVVGTNYFRLRIGDYRVILRIINNELHILVVFVEHRKKVYKRLSS